MVYETKAVIALMSVPITVIVSKYLMLRMRKFNKEIRIVGSDMIYSNKESFQKL